MLFVFCCGVGHALYAVEFWVPIYRISGLWHAVTAIVSLGTVGYLLTAARDLLKLQRDLQDDARLFENAWETGAVAICFVDPDAGKFLRANVAACEFFERTEQELQMLTFAQITHPDDIGADWAQWTEVRSGKRPRMVMEKRYLMPTPNDDGTTRWKWALLIASVVRARNGELLHSISVIQDIDAQKLVEHELKTRIAELEQLRLGGPGSVTAKLDELIQRWTKESDARG